MMLIKIRKIELANRCVHFYFILKGAPVSNWVPTKISYFKSGLQNKVPLFPIGFQTKYPY